MVIETAEQEAREPTRVSQVCTKPVLTNKQESMSWQNLMSDDTVVYIWDG